MALAEKQLLSGETLIQQSHACSYYNVKGAQDSCVNLSEEIMSPVYFAVHFAVLVSHLSTQTGPQELKHHKWYNETKKNPTN